MEKESLLLHILKRLCRFLTETGYQEKAIACYQAMIEFTCYAPPFTPSDASFNKRLDFFEEFWESEAPRFGEKNALGWATSMIQPIEPVSNEPGKIY